MKIDRSNVFPALLSDEILPALAPEIPLPSLSFHKFLVELNIYINIFKREF